MPLPTRKLGKNGPEVPALGLGFMGLSVGYGTARPDDERQAFLSHAYKSGETNWDTADIYGDNEDVLGKWLTANPDKRPNIFLATKFALKFEDGGIKIDSSPEHAKRAIDSSLKRLGVSYVDLYYCHRLDGKTPIEKTVEAMAEMKRDGKIKHIGLSEVSADSLRRAYKVAPIDAVQVEYSPFALDAEKVGLFEACRELGVALVAYSPLGRGMLSGAYKSRDDFEEGDYRRMTPRFSEENFPKNLDLVNKIQDLAKKKGVTASQLTLAWLMAQGEYVIPIPGTTKEARLDENLGALNVKLTPEEVELVRKTSEAAEVHGERAPRDDMGALFADSPPL